MIHKDVKPSNILIESQHNVVLADLGMMNKNGATPVFCAPEKLKKSEIEKTDVHAFGITILLSFYTFNSAMKILFLSKKDVSQADFNTVNSCEIVKLVREMTCYEFQKRFSLE